MIKNLELRLRIPMVALPDLRGHALLRSAEPRAACPAIEDTCFDTPNLRLRERRVSLVVRDDGREHQQRVSLLAPDFAGLSVRALDAQPYADGFDFSALADPELARLLERHAQRLAPVFRLRFRRQRFCCTPADGTRIRLAIDEGSIATEDASQPLAEVTLGAEAADRADLLEFAARLAADLPLLPTDLPRTEIGYRLLTREIPRPLRAEDSDLQGSETVPESFRTLAAACVRHWQGNAEAALDLGAGADPEFVHQVRVGLRRLRSVLRVFGPALPESFATGWRERLGQHARGLDATRDLDVFRDEVLAPVVGTALLADQALADLGRALETARQVAASAAAGTGLDQGLEGRLILECAAALLRLPPTDPGTPADLRTFAARRLRGLRRRARRRFTAAADLAPPSLHRLRIGLKDLRYGVEFFAPLLPERPLKTYLALLTRAQSALGFLHDLDVARTRLETWNAADPSLATPAGFVLGWHAPRYARLRQRVLNDCAPALWGKALWR